MQKAWLLWYSLLTVATHGECANPHPPVRKSVRDGPDYYNATTTAASASTSSTTSTWSTSNVDTSTSTRSATSPSRIPKSSTSPPQTTSNGYTTAPTTAPPTITYPLYPASNGTTTLLMDSCFGSVTYYNSVPPTVYLTVTEVFPVTVTASNATLPPVQIITPPPACSSTILPLAASLQPLAAVSSDTTWLVSSSDTTWPSSEATAPTDPPDPSKPGVPFATPAIAGPPNAATTAPVVFPVPAQASKTEAYSKPGASSVKTATYVPQIATGEPQPSTGSAYTSTVLVTKKTPVPVVVPPTSPPPDFQTALSATGPAPAPPQVSPTDGGNQPGYSNGGAGSTGAGGSTLDFGGGSQPTNGGSGDGGGGGGGDGGGNNGPPNTNPGDLVNTTPTTTRLENVIASIINTPFTEAGNPGQSNPITQAPAAPASTNINNVPVVILPSSVVIGGQLVSRPGDGSTPATVLVNGQTFAVGPSQIIAPGTTYAIQPQVLQQVSATYLPTPTVITAAGLVLTIGTNNAIVSGTTYAIGPNAPATTVVIGSQTLSIGSHGIILPSTTVLPEKPQSLVAPAEIITADGLTFSVEATAAIIGGTTYAIGSGAPTETAIINGQTVSIGPSGIGLTKTTIHPETLSTSTSTSTSTKVPGSAGMASFNTTTAVIWGGIIAVGAAVVLLI